MRGDYTFCMNDNCKVKRCLRHPSRVREIDIPHGYAEIEGTDLCPDFGEKDDEEKA